MLPTDPFHQVALFGHKSLQVGQGPGAIIQTMGRRTLLSRRSDLEFHR